MVTTVINISLKTIPIFLKCAIFQLFIIICKPFRNSKCFLDKYFGRFDYDELLFAIEKKFLQF